MGKHYRRKRDFDRTPEPGGQDNGSLGEEAPIEAGQFVVHKHDASQLHYDLRLAFDGVLKSWALPKGPSDRPSDKRLAVHVEDHPLAYGQFEGLIPKAQYGGGTVMLWDRGDYKAEGDIHRAYQRGEIKVTLHGQKLKGRWALVRTGNQSSKSGKNWLLIKDRDEHARDKNDSPVTDQRPISVKTGRDLNQIAGEPNMSDATCAFAPTMPKRAKKANLPRQVRPQLASLTDQPPTGDHWFHEIKFDGYRMLARLDQGEVKIVSRNGHDWTKRFPPIAEALAALPVGDAWIDGEITALQADGTTSFQALQNILRDQRSGSLVYFAFDLIHLNGRDMAPVTLGERKDLLAGLFSRHADQKGHLRYSDHVVGQGSAFHQRVCEHELEGMISKKANARYSPGRADTWRKIKCRRRGEFVIVGWTKPGGSRFGFGSLLLGYAQPDGTWAYAGRVGAGFDEPTLRDLRSRFAPLKVTKAPVVNAPQGVSRETNWVRPELVAEVRFAGWTDDALLRQAVFVGLREDKSAEQVTSEQDHMKTGSTKSGSNRSSGSKGNPSGRNNRNAGAGSAISQSSAQTTIAGVRLSHPDRVLYPRQGLTKADLASYYERIAEWILPHVADRPLSLLRCPGGQGSECFFQKHPKQSLPETIHGVKIQERKKTTHHLYINDLSGLISLIQLGVLEIHPWQCRVDRTDRPDRLVFDLDPGPGVNWAQVIQAARTLRDVLAEVDMRCFVKTSGSKGLHVVVPMERRHDFTEGRAFSQAIARTLVSRYPDRYIATMTRSKRQGKIFIDYFRNNHGATSVAAYSTRAKAEAPVSMPLRWDELTPDRGPAHYTVPNVPRRLNALAEDPWAGFDQVRQSLNRQAGQHFGVAW